MTSTQSSDFKTPMHKLHLLTEFSFLTLIFNSHDVIGCVSGMLATIYFANKIKIEVVDTKFGSSWLRFIKSWFGIK